MLKKALLQAECRVWRTYRGGRLLDQLLGVENPSVTEYPEDWISSFTEAKNKVYKRNEGISRVLSCGEEMLITEVVTPCDFGPGRDEPGVLVKYLDSAERLGIQVHPTPDFSRRHFGTDYGKTECWHILDSDATFGGEIYIGFKEGITPEIWRELFVRQDVCGMLSMLHRFSVKPGDTVLVRAGTPHAIGAGCFLVEIQEPTDYTMRVEKTTVSGDKLTPRQIHYGVGEESMLDCFIYEGLTRQEARERYFLPSREEGLPGGALITLVDYTDTPHFALKRLYGEDATVLLDSFVTAIVLRGGVAVFGDEERKITRGEKYFVPYGCGKITVRGAELLICYPPEA